MSIPVEVLFNFISPVTGRVLSDTNYVLYGDRRGIAQPSPIIIDIRLDLLNLRVDFDVASSASYIIGFSNSRLPNAQVLHSLSDGFLFNTSGIISTFSIIPIGALPDLPMGNIWIGDDMNRPVPNPTITIDNLPELMNGNLWIGNDMNRPIVSQIITIDNLPNLSSGKVWVGDGMFPSRPIERDFPLFNLPMGNIWIGDDMNNPIPHPTITIDNLPNLSSGKVWIGNGMSPSRPVEGNPPQGPAGPAGPAGPGSDSPSNLLSTAVGSAVSSGVKFGLEKLFTETGSAVGSAFGKAILLGYGGLLALNTAINLADTISDAVANNRDKKTPYLDYRTFNTSNNSLIGLRGAAGLSVVSTLFIISNLNLKGSRLEDISPSPGADYDAVPAKWVWDLLNDNVEIKWA